MNQSETNPLATALAALMTGHNANPNTSLRIPLVDSNGNLQPGPTLAELASVLGAQKFKVNLTSTDDFNTIDEGIFTFIGGSIPSHAPSGLNVSGVIECCFLSSNGNVRMQTITTRDGIQFVRTKYSSGDTWFNWKQI